MLQQGKEGLWVSFHEEVERSGLEYLGHLFQEGSGGRFAKCLLQNIPGVLQTAVGHHLVGETQLIKFVQGAFHLRVGGFAHLGYFKGQVFNVLLI